MQPPQPGTLQGKEGLRGQNPWDPAREVAEGLGSSSSLQGWGFWGATARLPCDLSSACELRAGEMQPREEGRMFWELLGEQNWVFSLLVTAFWSYLRQVT